MPDTRSGPVRSEAARQSILQATVTLLAERGYDNLTIEGIAARAGVGKQTVYRWWPSKSSIIAECLVEGLLLPVHLRVPDTGDIRRDLTTWLTTLFGYLQTEQGATIFRSLLAVAATDEAVGSGLRDSVMHTQSLSTRLHSAIGTAPNLPEGAPVEEIADALVGALVLRNLARRPIEEGDAERLVEAVIGP
ncbi:TetR/AcrR family transcriptional regulator [Microbacterium laevaniformans]|uniref:TetR/AcrR family transcriptional regulator n=1 Tax=Microbacterium laevaniformans TaxID=36807 RepID=UPI0036411EDD